jgi:hypothetical protein
MWLIVISLSRRIALTTLGCRSQLLDQSETTCCRGTIISIDKVKNEIYKNEDDLKGWCGTNLPNDFFKDSTEAVTEHGQVASWAYSRRLHYTAGAVTEFLSVDEADAWLVAYGLALPTGRTVVTYEKSDPRRKNKIKIPEACNHFGVPFLDTVSMLRVLNEPI